VKVLVCGGRDYSNYECARKALDALHALRAISRIIEGGARGGDFLARMWAKDNKVKNQTFPADWETYGKKAGYMRNVQMIEEGKPNFVVAFPGGKGTANMVGIAQNNGVTVWVPFGLVGTSYPMVRNLKSGYLEPTSVDLTQKWSNPYEGRCRNREEAIEKFKASLLKRPDLMKKVREELRGKDLLCHCAPLPCHGDILLKVANQMRPIPA
jgi:hypothetical protein